MSAGKVARRCACRGVLEASPHDPADVTRAVVEHRDTIQHQQWAASAQLAGQLVAPNELARLASVRRVDR